jgi:beta-galactosidase/beta-glucuronidase
MMAANWEIVVAAASEVDATVVVHYSGDANGVTLRGELRGPYCERAHTLPAQFPFRLIASTATKPNTLAAEALVTDPCNWSEELPHLYRARVEAVRGGEVVDEYHGEIGIKRTREARNFDGIK